VRRLVNGSDMREVSNRLAARMFRNIIITRLTLLGYHADSAVSRSAGGSAS